MFNVVIIFYTIIIMVCSLVGGIGFQSIETMTTGNAIGVAISTLLYHVFKSQIAM